MHTAEQLIAQLASVASAVATDDVLIMRAVASAALAFEHYGDYAKK